MKKPLKKHELMRDLIAGAMNKVDLLKLINALEEMDACTKEGEQKGDCLFVANQLRQGYFNWNGEPL